MKHICVILLLSVALLLFLGYVMLDSATITQDSPRRLQMHLVWMGLGLISLLAVSFTNYYRLRKPWVIHALFGFTMILLGLVLFLGEGTNGARRWLPVGGQPSEIAKLVLILTLAYYGVRHQSRMQERNRGFFYPSLIVAIPVLLIFAEPDWGTAVLLCLVGGALLLMSGTNWFYIMSTGIIGGEVFTLLLLQNPHRLARVISFWDPERYQYGIGWQGWHSVLSIASGGLYGKYFGHGTHKLGFVPEQQTDFIFSLIGEELGFVGSIGVLILFVIIIICGFQIAWRIADPFGRLVAAGVTLLIGLQAFLNIGVATSSLPNKGIPLPFVSYGGSSLVCMLTCIGLLVSIAWHGPVMPKVKLVRQKSPESPQTAHFQSTSNPFSGLAIPSRFQRLAFWRKAKRSPAFIPAPRHAYQRPPKTEPVRGIRLPIRACLGVDRRS